MNTIKIKFSYDGKKVVHKRSFDIDSINNSMEIEISPQEFHHLSISESITLYDNKYNIINNYFVKTEKDQYWECHIKNVDDDFEKEIWEDLPF